MADNIAVILAGGIGSRLGSELPKQFCEIKGRTVIEHTILAFSGHPEISEVAVVIHPEYLSLMQSMIKIGRGSRITKIISGGENRYDSSYNALSAYRERAGANILLHDAARPVVSHALISRVLNALEDHDAVSVTLPLADTLVRVDSNGRVLDFPDRANLRCAQTPQGFKVQTLARAFDEFYAGDKGYLPTDDCGLVFHYLPHVRIASVVGDASNIKITYRSDLELAERLL